MIFLTGSTGVLGSELLGRMLASSPDSRVALLMRGGAAGNPQERCGALLAELFGDSEARQVVDRVTLVDADLTTPGWGLSERAYQELAAQVHSVYHCAATTSLDTDWETAKRINVDGTAEVLRFAAQAASSNAAFQRFHYVSTAYVAGATESVVTPAELNAEGQFRNSYERSKAVAETLVRARQSDGIPTTIYRPSIIVGDSRTGHTSAFNVIYIPAKLLVNGFFSSFPALPHAVFDVVPVDYAAEAILGIAATPESSGRCFHITSGVGRESTLREIIDFLFATFNKYRKLSAGLQGKGLLAKPPFVSPELMAVLAQSSLNAAVHSMRTIEKLVSDHLKVFRKTLPFVPYMLSNPRFDNSSTVSILNGYETPLFASYAERLFKYCLDTNWGKIEIAELSPRFTVGVPLRFAAV